MDNRESEYYCNLCGELITTRDNLDQIPCSDQACDGYFELCTGSPNSREPYPPE